MITNISDLFTELRATPGVDPAKVDKLIAMIRAVPALERDLLIAANRVNT